MPHLRYNNNEVGGALVPYIGPNGNWWIGKKDTGTSANFSGTTYTPIKGVDYFTEEDIAELLKMADATLVMKTIISNIGDMTELSDESAESLVEAINNYAIALKELQTQIITINNKFVDDHMTREDLHMSTYITTDEFNINVQAPVLWQQIKSSYPLGEIDYNKPQESSVETLDLETANADMDAEDAVYATTESNKYVSVSNISHFDDETDDVSEIAEGETVATLNN